MNWRYAYTALVACTLAFGATMVARLVISPVVPLITADLGISNTRIGLALSGMWLAYAMAQFPSGVFADRIGERKIILAALGITAVASLLLAAAPGPEAFLAVAVILGAGAGLHYSVATTFLSRQFDEIGRAIGVHVAGGPLAGLIAPPVAALVGARYGWRPAILLGSGVAVLIFGLFWTATDPTEPSRPDGSVIDRLTTIGPLIELMSRPPIVYTTLLSIAGAFSWQATASFLPAFLVAAAGLSPARASLLFSLYFIVHGATQPVTGWISDRLSRDSAATITMAAGVVGYGLLVVGATRGWAIGRLAVACVIVGVAMSWGAPLQSRFIDTLGDAERGAGFGLVRTSYMIVGATGSVVTGALADLLGWTAAFSLLIGVTGFGFATLITNRLLELDL
ncbi:MAG: arabinose efflux permease [Halorubrum sp. J07HR59]|nr:MAG: arabinose efflux permease [Halorubrum sp. J07HR59]